jgi:hypothetical protein
MKPFIRITMSMACLALLLWGGIAVPAETSPAPESCEYLMTVVEGYTCPESCEYLTTVVEGYSCPESCEYLTTVVEAHPNWGIADVVASDQIEAAMWLAYGYGGSEEDWEWVVPAEPMFAEVQPPEAGTYEYSLAMETGSLPSPCADEACPAEEFTIIEVGGIPYRLEVDFGGN